MQRRSFLAILGAAFAGLSLQSRIETKAKEKELVKKYPEVYKNHSLAPLRGRESMYSGICYSGQYNPEFKKGLLS